MRFLFAALLGLTLTGCGYSYDELRRRPADWTVTSEVPWDQVAVCLASAYDKYIETHFEPQPTRKRARLALIMDPGFGRRMAVAIFEVENTGDKTTVAYRHGLYPPPGLDKQAAEKVSGCLSPTD
jgi:hypothetical protein